jgi:hypothetical protein
MVMMTCAPLSALFADLPKTNAAGKKSAAVDLVEPIGASEVVRFSWRPKGGPSAAYAMESPEDQHRIILSPGVSKGGAFPVVVGFHGQPRRGTPPRDYKFLKKVPEVVSEIVKKGELRPFVLVLPVFRFSGQNWPGFDPGEFRAEVEKRLKSLGISASKWYAFGHSGAAGCGGAGLNHAHAMNPSAVGFFDTCLGKGWQKAIKKLRDRKTKTLNIHSVETAGFRPRQRPEYQSKFDFGRAFGPVGMKPVSCPASHPGEKLRDQPYRCAATPDGVVEGYVVDTGEGKVAHEVVLKVAVRYFLTRFIGSR